LEQQLLINKEAESNSGTEIHIDTNDIEITSVENLSTEDNNQ
jgi:hypothetical protein